MAEDVTAWLIANVPDEMRELLVKQLRKSPMYNPKRPVGIGIYSQSAHVWSLVLVGQLENKLMAVKTVWHLVDDFGIELQQFLIRVHRYLL
jgi:hypothetical protein